MKKHLFLAIVLIFIAVGLFSQNTPRVLNVRLVNQDLTPLPNTPADITWQATINNGSVNTLIQSSPGCGFTFGGGNLYAKIELGNFSAQWVNGNTVTINVQRISDGATGSADDIVLAGAGTIWWGREPVATYGGAPVVLIPPVAADTYTYNLTVNGPVGFPVTGPGAYSGAMDGTVYTCGPNDTDINDLVGMWEAGPAGEGFYWVVNPIEVTAGMFTDAKTDYVRNAMIEFVRMPIPDTYSYTLYVTGPDGYAVMATNPMYSGTTDYDVTAADVNDLLGLYTIAAPLPGWEWAVNPIEVTADGWTLVTKAAVTGTRSASSKAHYAYEKTIEFVMVELPPVYDIPEGDSAPIPGTEAGNTVQMTQGNANFGAGAATPPVNPTFTPGFVQFLTLVAPGPWQLSITTTYPWLWIVGIGVFEGPGTFVIDVPVSKNQPLEIQGGSGGNPTLPVELSSFTAVLTAQNFVKLTWVSQSETEMLGYKVYRGESGDLANAVLITPSLIGATNTSTTQTYSVTDNEVSIGSTYWYWLESVDYASSHFHGPVSIIVEGNVPPVLPEVTSMRNAYPNPFRMNSATNIEVAIKAGETGTVTIYNILGQAVKTYTVREGNHKINWNGRDAKGNACGSGIYFYKLSTPSMNQTRS